MLRFCQLQFVKRLYYFLTFSFSSELYIMSSIGANSSPSNANAATEYWLKDFFVLVTKSDDAVAATDAAAIATAIAVSLSTRSKSKYHSCGHSSVPVNVIKINTPEKFTISTWLPESLVLVSDKSMSSWLSPIV